MPSYFHTDSFKISEFKKINKLEETISIQEQLKCFNYYFIRYNPGIKAVV